MAQGKIDLDIRIDKDKIAEAMRPMRLLSIGAEVAQEVGRARQKHGPNSDLEFGTGPGHNYFDRIDLPTDLYNWQTEQYVKAVVDRLAADGGRHTRADILFEEFVEALAEDDPAKLRGELIQVAAMAVDWIADIDARQEA